VVLINFSKKTVLLLQACTAFSFITIPSLENNLAKFNLFIESGQTALNNQCVSQADAMFKSAISLVMDLNTFKGLRQAHFWSNFQALSCNFLSSLILVPDNTEQGVLYLLRGFLNVISELNHIIPKSVSCNIYISVLAILSAYSQEQYLYQIDKIESNETLYSNEPKFLQEISVISQTVLNQILSFFESTNDKSSSKSNCVVGFLETIIAHADLTDESMMKLFIKTWRLINNINICDSKQLARITKYISNRSEFQCLFEQISFNTQV